MMIPTILVLLPILSLAAPAPQILDPALGQIKINNVAASGSGCPQGSFIYFLDPEIGLVTFGFDSFGVTIGPNAQAQPIKSRNCQIHLDLSYPNGIQVSVMSATYHGYARLDPGVTGTFLSTYYFSQSASSVVNTRGTISGPGYAAGSTFTVTDNIDNFSTVWSPCGARGWLNIDNRLALATKNATATGEISDDDATFDFEQKFYFRFQNCNPTATSTVAPAPTISLNR